MGRRNREYIDALPSCGSAIAELSNQPRTSTQPTVATAGVCPRPRAPTVYLINMQCSSEQTLCPTLRLESSFAHPSCCTGPPRLRVPAPRCLAPAAPVAPCAAVFRRVGAAGTPRSCRRHSRPPALDFRHSLAVRWRGRSVRSVTPSAQTAEGPTVWGPIMHKHARTRTHIHAHACSCMHTGPCEVWSWSSCTRAAHAAHAATADGSTPGQWERAEAEVGRGWRSSQATPRRGRRRR